MEQVLDGKKSHSSDVNNQNLEKNVHGQSRKVQKASMQCIRIQTMTDHHIFLKTNTCEKYNSIAQAYTYVLKLKYILAYFIATKYTFIRISKHLKFLNS